MTLCLFWCCRVSTEKTAINNGGDSNAEKTAINDGGDSNAEKTAINDGGVSNAEKTAINNREETATRAKLTVRMRTLLILC